MNIIYIKGNIYEHKNYSGRRDYPRGGKDLSILKIEKRDLSLIL
jgi:hypothetical protein